jgi:hypothetical protein
LDDIRRLEEKQVKRNLHAKRSNDPINAARGRQRVASQAEEIVVDADLIGIQHFGPNLQQSPLGFGVGRGSRTPVHAIFHNFNLVIQSSHFRTFKILQTGLARQNELARSGRSGLADVKR